jgi:aspartyl/asparaginyl beta-hydroxylase (cupin superfamily)
MISDQDPAVARLAAEAQRAAREGREGEAIALWTRLLNAAPGHPQALTGLGLSALRRGDARRAVECLAAAAQATPGEAMAWINLAMARKAVGDRAGEAVAVEQALVCDPSDLIALIMKARLLDAAGRTGEAARIHAAVIAVAPPSDRLSPDLREAVSQSRARVESSNRVLETLLNDRLSLTRDQRPRRFNEAVDILLGKQKRYEQAPAQLFYPELAPIYFFDRSLFPWLDAFDAATPEITREFVEAQVEAQSDPSAFRPYTAYPPGVPLNQWAELNNSDRWQAFHLIEKGQVVAANAARCPKTMALLAQAPQPSLPNRTPSAMFSLLAPKTRIPAHTGVVNTRLVVHTPLIVPEDCGFRVGSETRPWRVGESWVFDDTIDHEAWNDSAHLRVILIFDIWRPELSEEERRLLAELMATLDVHGQSGEAYAI